MGNNINDFNNLNKNVDDIVAHANSESEIQYDAKRLVLFLYQLYKQKKTDKIESGQNHRILKVCG